MQPEATKRVGILIFYLSYILNQSQKTLWQTATNKNDTLIIRMRYSFQLAKNVKTLIKFHDLKAYQDEMNLSVFFGALLITVPR